jgi:hypothetical protein
MNPLTDVEPGMIVLVEREDHGADRIPKEYRLYLTEKDYIYRARVIQLCPMKRFHRVWPLPLQGDGTGTRFFTRKAYKSKIYAAA